MSYEAVTINSGHNDLIHDIAYNFYGDRMATCSSDQMVKIWDKDPIGNWNLSAAWKAHSGSIWKVTWALPEFGQVIGTCSFDRTASVWEEIAAEYPKSKESNKHWVRRANLVDSRMSVTDIKFAPPKFGLCLATCSTDGTVRVYEAPDVMNLSQWTQQHDIPCKYSCSSLAWNHSYNRTHLPLIAVGCDEATSSPLPKIFIFEYLENIRKYEKIDGIVSEPVYDIAFAPTLGRSFHLLAVATKNIRLIKIKPTPDNVNSRYEITQAMVVQEVTCIIWRASWNALGTVLATSGDDGIVRFWKEIGDSWRSVSMVKADNNNKEGETTSTTPENSGTTDTLSSSQPSSSLPKARYLKLGTISHPSQVPNH